MGTSVGVSVGATRVSRGSAVETVHDDVWSGMTTDFETSFYVN